MDVAGRVREGIGREEEMLYNMRRANHQSQVSYLFPTISKKQMMTSDSNSYNEHERGGGHVSVEILHGGRDTIEANRELLLGNLCGPLSARAVSILVKNKTPH